jgi:hypothetical protein
MLVPTPRPICMPLTRLVVTNIGRISKREEYAFEGGKRWLIEAAIIY